MNSFASSPPLTNPEFPWLKFADCDRGSGPEIIVGFTIEQANRPGVGVTLEVSTDPVVAIAQSVGE